MSLDITGRWYPTRPVYLIVLMSMTVHSTLEHLD